MQQHTLLIASADDTQRTFIAAQLDADGHTVYESHSPARTIAKLSTDVIDVLLLADLARPADSPTLLRAIRADEHTRIHPAQAVITLGAADELSALRAYEAGSDHHLPASTPRGAVVSEQRACVTDIRPRQTRPARPPRGPRERDPSRAPRARTCGTDHARRRGDTSRLAGRARLEHRDERDPSRRSPTPAGRIDVST